MTSNPLGDDVYNGQGAINWQATYNNGNRFAFIKASEGSSFIDPQFASNYSGAYNAGIVRGAYHFALPYQSSGTAQADFFVDHGGGWSGDGRTLPPAVDVEYNPYTSSNGLNTCYGLSAAQWTSWLQAFVNEVHTRTTRWPVIYTNLDYWTTCLGNTTVFSANDPLWVAAPDSSSPGTLPGGWANYTFWQYSFNQTPFPGDQDVFNGTLGQLTAFATGGSGMAAHTAPSYALNQSNNDQFVFFKGTDGQVHSGHWNGTNWIPASEGWATSSAPAVAVNNNNEQFVYYRGSDGTIHGQHWNGTAWLASNPGWTASSAPSVVVKPNSGEQFVFFRGNDGTVYSEHWNGTGWVPSHEGWATVGTPSVAMNWTTGEQFVFFKGTDGKVHSEHWNGTTWIAANEGWTTSSDPSVGVDNNNEQFVFFTGTDGLIHEGHWNGTGWITSTQGWASSSMPGVAVNPSNDEQYVAFTDGNGQITEAHYNGVGWLLHNIGYTTY